MRFGSKKESAGLYVGKRSYVYLMLESSGSDIVLADSSSGSLETPLSGSLFSSAESDLSRAFAQVSSSVKAVRRAKVHFAIPMTDSLLRVASMAGLTLDEAKKAFRYEVERHFPFKADDCVFDLDEIDYPIGDGAERRFVVSAAKRAPAELICRSARSHGLRFGAMEPEQTAIERAVSHFFPNDGGCVALYAGTERALVVFVWRGKGIFYRNISALADEAEDNLDDKASSLADEMRASVQFGLSRNEGFLFDEIFLFGPGASGRLRAALCDSFADCRVSVVFPERRFGAEFPAHEGWIAALGLALRGYDC